MAARKNVSKKSTASRGRSKGTTKKQGARASKRSANGARAVERVVAAERAAVTKARKKVVRALTEAQRRKLVALPDDYVTTVEALERAWAAERALRVPSLTLARLRSLSRAAQRAREREAVIREEMERRLGAAYDLRLQAENDLYRAMLSVNAAVKAHARRDAAILDRFAFLGDVVEIPVTAPVRLATPVPVRVPMAAPPPAHAIVMEE